MKRISASSCSSFIELSRANASTEGKRRSVKTLSGGGKFLVARSLPIGLSTVVQSQSGGVRLDAMFIDEAFGIPDKNTVQDEIQKRQTAAGVCCRESEDGT